MEEAWREVNDLEEQLIIIMLDAKSAFDVVVLNDTTRRLYHYLLMPNLHKNATTSVKWNGYLSNRFNIQQEVRQ